MEGSGKLAFMIGVMLVALSWSCDSGVLETNPDIGRAVGRRERRVPLKSCQ